MLTNKVRTYSVHRPAPETSVFILNRGHNAGKSACRFANTIKNINKNNEQTAPGTLPELLHHLLWQPGRTRNRLLDLLRTLEKRVLSSLSLRQRHRNAQTLRAEEAAAELHPAWHRKSHPKPGNDPQNQIDLQPGTEATAAVPTYQPAPRCTHSEILLQHLKTKNSLRGIFFFIHLKAENPLKITGLTCSFVAVRPHSAVIFTPHTGLFPFLFQIFRPAWVDCYLFHPFPIQESYLFHPF